MRDSLEVSRLCQELWLGHGDESPIALPDALVEPPEHLALSLELAEVDAPESDAGALLDPLRQLVHPRSI